MPDGPIPFGYKTAWYAVRSLDAEAIISGLELKNPVRGTWAEGITAAYEGKVFITPPVNDWTLVVGIALASEINGSPGDIVSPRVRSLSKLHGEAQFFFSHRVVEAHLWAKAKAGRLLRGFCFVGDRGENTWNVGKPTAAEFEAGFRDSDDYSANEETVMAIAGQWSINPCEIDQIMTTP